MKIGIDVSPLQTGHFLQHRVRGTGFYIENLKVALLKDFPQHTYTFFTRGENLPKDIDLVHIPYFEPFFLTLPLAKSFPTVVTVHDLTPLVFPSHFPAGVRGRIKWEIQKIALKNASSIIADSQSSKRDIMRFAGMDEEKIHVIYLAAPSVFKKADQRSTNKIKEKYKLPKQFVLYVGDATWNKNIPRLIEAVKMVNIPFVMVGKALKEEHFDRTNPWNQDLVKIKELVRDDKNIQLLGFIPIEDLIGIYNLATVFAMPSLYEGFGLPIVEAMACGTPVVTTKAGSLSEIAGDAVFYVDPYDSNSIASGISEVFFSQELQNKLSKNGMEQAKKFSWEKTATATVGVYEKVLAKQ